jgi:hypothetical protein
MQDTRKPRVDLAGIGALGVQGSNMGEQQCCVLLR